MMSKAISETANYWQFDSRQVIADQYQQKKHINLLCSL